MSLPKDVKLPPSFVFREASSRDIIVTLARYGNLNVVFDPAFREAPVTTELRNVTLEDALTSITSSTRTFYKVTAPRTITIVPDTPAKRREYEDEIVRTFFLSNADLEGNDRPPPHRGRPPPHRRPAGDQRDHDQGHAGSGRGGLAHSGRDRQGAPGSRHRRRAARGRSKAHARLGLQIASPGTPPTGIDGSVDVNRQGLTLDDLRHLTAADIFVTGVPGIYYRLIKTDQSTRTLANPQLRTAEGHRGAGQVRRACAGASHDLCADRDRRRAAAAGNVVQLREHRRQHRHHAANAPQRRRITGIEGGSERVSAGFGGLPTFANRYINTVIRLKDGETNMLAGLIRDDERNTLDGHTGAERHCRSWAGCSRATGRKRSRPTSSSR